MLCLPSLRCRPKQRLAVWNFVVIAALGGFVSSVANAQSREEKVREDRKRVVADGFWMYNDISGAMSKAKVSGKPVLVVLRCIPCEECVKLDDDLVDKDPVIRPLLEQYVCVRQVSTNGLDLDLFQYDTDQSFAVFMLNADGTIYGRFGTRSHQTEWFGDVSLKGLAASLKGGLELHAKYDSVKASLAGKRGEPLEFKSPEKYPALKDKFTDALNYKGNVVKSCIHCHQIGDARREYYLGQGKPIPDDLFFPYPHPKAIGLIMDADTKATVKSVRSGSIAEAGGFQPGDQIASLDGQPILSIADVQWVLNGKNPEGDSVKVVISRDDVLADFEIRLPNGWRRADDISWRVSTWPYRRMVTGGMLLVPVDDEQRRELGLSQTAMALRVNHLGQYGAHAAAKRAGFKKEDVLVSFDGRSDLESEPALMHYALSNRKPGQRVDVVVRRGRESKTLRLPIQK